MSALIDGILGPVNLFLLVAVAGQIAVVIKPEIIWERRGPGRNRLEAMPPRLAAVLTWVTRCAALATIAVIVAIPFF